MGSLSLLQGIFPTEESNWGLLHCRRILYQLSYERRSQGSCSAPKLTSEGKGQHVPRVLDSSTWILPPLRALSCGSASWNLAHFCSSSGPLGTQSRLDQPVMLSTLGQLPSWPPTSLPISSSLTEKCFSAQARSVTEDCSSLTNASGKCSLLLGLGDQRTWHVLTSCSLDALYFTLH